MGKRLVQCVACARTPALQNLQVLGMLQTHDRSRPRFRAQLSSTFPRVETIGLPIPDAAFNGQRAVSHRREWRSSCSMMRMRQAGIGFFSVMPLVRFTTSGACQFPPEGRSE